MCYTLLPCTRAQGSLRALAGAAVVLSVLLPAGVLAQDSGRTKPESAADCGNPVLSVVTLNLAKEKDTGRILKEWRNRTELWNSDVLLLQEVAHFAGDRPSVAHTLAEQMGRYVTSAPSIPNKDVDGLAIVSRYPLSEVERRRLDHNNMVFHTRHRIMIAATVDTPSGSLRVYNIHLDSRINARTRLRQIAPVLSDAEQWDGPRVIGGDFNTNYLRWVGNVLPIGLSLQSRAVRRAMSAKGFTTALENTGPTSDFFRLRLDWLYTRGVQVLETAIEPVRFSDHHAVRIKVTAAPRRDQRRNIITASDCKPREHAAHAGGNDGLRIVP